MGIYEVQHPKMFLIMKPTRCTNFSNLFLELSSRCSVQFLCPSAVVSHCTHSNGIGHTDLLTACERDQDGTSFHPDPARKLSANLYDLDILLTVHLSIIYFSLFPN